MPVFTALAPDVESARKLIEQAEEEAADIVRRAREQATALLAQAQLDSRSARAGAAARVAQDNTDHDRALLANARNQADVLARTGTALLPDMTHSVIGRMLAGLRRR